MFLGTDTVQSWTQWVWSIRWVLQTALRRGGLQHSLSNNGEGRINYCEMQVKRHWHSGRPDSTRQSIIPL